MHFLILLLLAIICQLSILVNGTGFWSDKDEELAKWSPSAVAILTGHKHLTPDNLEDAIASQFTGPEDYNRKASDDKDYITKLGKSARLEKSCETGGTGKPDVYEARLKTIKKLRITDPHLKALLDVCFKLQTNNLFRSQKINQNRLRNSFMFGDKIVFQSDQEDRLMVSLDEYEAVLDGTQPYRLEHSHTDVLKALEGAVMEIEQSRVEHGNNLPTVYEKKLDKYVELLSVCNYDSKARTARLALIDRYRKTDPHLSAYLDECYRMQTSG